ncbi:competence protein ComEA [Desulfohalotomaculum tongense]|uniref:helix-hairpin-helix domain-containing protein n=1 Tax=Desulforadius tongensis TaxID=1216062 RepID=UPI00195BB680|nr:helix-hairpin-helix domain-containing protein [Desulforadius tongensis]MBM7855694.1 competence protein ComEA [Desulforadius tongensis]
MFTLGRREQLVILILLAALLFGSGYRLAEYKNAGRGQQPVLVAGEREAKKSAPLRETVVYVSGAVKKPGVYRLDQGSRVIDALQKAGGPREDADLGRLNLAAPLADGQQVDVPVKAAAAPEGDMKSTTPFALQSSSGAGKININTASEAELTALPGIGPALSKRIVEYRRNNGGFKSIAEIKKVSGIGDKKYENLKEMISVY